MDRTNGLELLITSAAAFGLSLDDEALRRFSTYRSLLQTWGSKMNLSTRLGDRDIVVHHFLDSLSGAPLLRDTPAAAVVDLGCGAGFPLLPLKMALPGLRVLLVESSGKKVSFCKEVVRATRLQGCQVVWGRGEAVGEREEHRGAYDWAVSRALGQAAAVVKLALPFLRPTGRVLLYKGAPAEEELSELSRLCGEVGATWESHRIVVPHLDAARTHLVVRRHGLKDPL